MQILSEARERYMAKYRAVVRVERLRHDKCVPEVLLELGDGKNLYKRLYRADIGLNDGGNASFIEINLDQDSTIESECAEIVGAKVVIFSLVWNDVSIVAKDIRHVDIEAWHAKWADPEDKMPADQDGLAAVIHSVSEPNGVDGSIRLAVDFGSAPIAAVIELIECLAKTGSKHISIGTINCETRSNTLN
jgi:hypothetical protein